MGEYSRNLRSIFRPWLISLVAGNLFALFTISLNYLLKGKPGFQFFEIDYTLHLFFSSPFSRLDNMDTIVVLGSTLTYWGVGGFLSLRFPPEINLKKSAEEQISVFSQIITTGFLIHSFLLLTCCGMLAFYEGYMPMIFDNSYLNHGPWRLLSHLKLLSGWSFLQIVISLIMSVSSFLIRFNKEAIILFAISCLVLVFNFCSYMWLFD